MAKTFDKSVEALQSCADALEELADLWSTRYDGPLWWDSYHSVLVARRNGPELRAVYGRHPLLRSITSGGRVRRRTKRLVQLLAPGRWRGPAFSHPPVPCDAIIWSPVHQVRKIVVISVEAGLVLKISYEKEKAEREAAIWEFVAKAGMQKHVPAMVANGVTTGGARWMLSEFVPNHDPISFSLNPFFDPKQNWIWWRRRKIFPLMESFFEASGIESIDAGALLRDTKEAIQQSNPLPELKALVHIAESAASGVTCHEMLLANTHQDLSAGHIHRSGEHWWIIDWGSTGRTLTAISFFRRYVWSPIGSDRTALAFWFWLGGRAAFYDLPSSLRSEIGAFLDWYGEWRDVDMDPESLRFQLLVKWIDDLHRMSLAYSVTGNLVSLETREDAPLHIRSFAEKVRAVGVA